MNQIRLIISLILTVCFTLLSIFTLHRDSSDLPAQEKPENINVDQLRDITYRSTNRKQNFEAYGLTNEEVEQALALAKEAEEYEKKIIAKLDEVYDTDLLGRTFCGESSDIRPRYAVLRYAVTEKGEKRIPLDMKRIKFKPEKWVDGLGLKDMYAEVELRKDPYIDSTVMMIGAILAGEEELLIDRQPPFGRGSDWSWKKAKKEFPGIQEAVVKYLANMHVLVEIAQGPDGVCGVQ